MTTEILNALFRANLAGGAAILVVLALRIPARRAFGPEVAYKLWFAPVLAAAVTLLPPRIAPGAVHKSLSLAALGASPTWVAAVWLLGLVAAGALFWRAQARFIAEARAGRAGPSVVGVITPRILMPPDDGSYTPEERELVRAPEREHVARRDPRAGALAAAFQCLAWFNPLVHVAAHFMRLDQEFACDAAVTRRYPRSRALYAKTLLKTQLAATPLPFGCYWPARGEHPLEVRVRLLKGPRQHSGLAGPLLVASGVVCVTVAAWAAQPPIPPAPMPVSIVYTEHEHGQMSVLLISAPRGTWSHHGAPKA
jgi:beta-lactamase regulating signal transducer with metallopeptidase domain